MLTIVLPTRNRTEQLRRVLVSFAETTTKHVCEVIVIVDADDPASLRTCIDIATAPEYAHLQLRCMKDEAAPTAIEKWNTGARASRYKKFSDAWLMLAADDIMYPAGWLDLAMATPNKGFLAFRDSETSVKQYEPHFMATINWFKCFNGGVLAIPHYKQWGIDVETADRAHQSNTYNVSKGVLPVTHMLFGTAPNDSTYERGAQYHQRDLELLAKRREAGYPDDFEGYL